MPRVPALEKFLQFTLGTFLFLLPWQTIWITQEKFLNGVKWEWGTIGWYGTEVLLWFCIGLFIVWYWRKWKLGNWEIRKLTITRDRVFLLACLLFIVYCFLSTLWALDREVSWQQAFRILEAVLLFLMLYIGPLSWQKAATWLVAGAVGQSILGIWQFLTQSTFSSTLLGTTEHPASVAGTFIVQSDVIGRWLRAYGSFPHPNVFGGYLVVSLVLTLLLLDRVNEKRIQNLLLSIAALLQSAALFFTFSRSAWLACMFIIFGVGFLEWKNIFLRRTIYSMLALIAVLVFLYNPLLLTRTNGESAAEIRSVSERLSGYAEADEIIKTHLLFGVGAGNYTAVAYVLDPSRKGWDYQPVHNVPLLILGELGVLGFLLLLGVVVTFIRIKTKIKIKIKITITILLYFVSIAPIIFFDHYIFSSYIGLMLVAVYVSLISRSLYTVFPQE